MFSAKNLHFFRTFLQCMAWFDPLAWPLGSPWTIFPFWGNDLMLETVTWHADEGSGPARCQDVWPPLRFPLMKQTIYICIKKICIYIYICWKSPTTSWRRNHHILDHPQDKWTMKIKWKKSPTTISGVDFLFLDSHQIGSKKSLQFFIVWLFTFPIGLIGTFASGQLQVERTRVRWSNDQRSSWNLSLV